MAKIWRGMTAAQYLRWYLFGNPVENAKAKLTKAMTRYAEREAEATFSKVMLEHHTHQTSLIDPTLDWWGYATERQALEDSALDHRYHRLQVDRTRVAMNARQEAYRKIRHGEKS